MKSKLLIPLIAMAIFFSISSASEEKVDPALMKKAREIHERAIVIDTHMDTPLAIAQKNINIGERQTDTEVDLPRMKEGGVDAAFFAVFLSNDLDDKQPSKKALELIDLIYEQLRKNADLAEIALSPEDIVRIHKTGKRAILIGMENGGPVEGSLPLLRIFYRLGVRYITLTHVKDNFICDSSTDEPKWNGLSDAGKEIVREMNRLGMMIDVSHISDKSFRDVLEISRAPVIASHSCVRSICDVPRNLSDDMIKALAEKGGVIQINFYSGFLSDDFAKKSEEVRKKIQPQSDALKEKYKDDYESYYNELYKIWIENAPESVDIGILIDHIDYVVKLVGADYVGLGSDFDGASSYPAGLEDISGYPLITYHLLKRGYSEEDIKKILGGNLLRVFREVQKLAEK